MVVAVILTVMLSRQSSVNGNQAGRVMGYEEKIFDTSIVHTIDIQIDDWEGFLETAMQETYSPCTLIIDGETYANVGIRGKGNTSLSSVQSIGNDRYSFKVEFDQYQTGNTYYGLDKLCLNNLYADNTYMKDYLCYTMMQDMGVASPLCSYVYLTVNGEDWGLYLAAEGVEESFLQRNYGNDYGQLYKPDTVEMGGGVGHGKDFSEGRMEGFREQLSGTEMLPENGNFSVSGNELAGLPQMNGDLPRMPESELPGMSDGEMPQMPQMPDKEMPGLPQMPGTPQNETTRREEFSDGDGMPQMGSGGNQMAGGGRDGEIGGMGSADVKLQYIDDDTDSYNNIFDNAKTSVTNADEQRLIQSLKHLSNQENLDEIVDIETVIKYFVVHNFVCNGDSYTGSMVHNYYLYEENGQLSMIPWDYNLAFGGFSRMGGGFGGNSSSQATSEINSPIDSPVSGGNLSDRPMVAWIFDEGEYEKLYHNYYTLFIKENFSDNALEKEILRVQQLIAPYVEKDPTAFCSYEEFVAGVEALKEFLALRAESVIGQLAGTIPTTSEGQAQDSSTLVQAEDLDLTLMGEMNMGGGRTPQGGRGSQDAGKFPGGRGSQDIEEFQGTVDSQDAGKFQQGGSSQGGIPEKPAGQE